MQFYKPNAKNTGSAVGFNFNSKEGALHAQFVKQTGPKSFKGGKRFNVKFNATEIGVFLNCIERGRAEKLFHQSEKGNTSIEIKEYLSNDVKNGFTISVNPRANEGEEKPQQFGFWFNAAEARTLKEYLQFVLGHFFAAEYSADKQRRAEYAKKNAENSSSKEKVEKPDPFG
jgi:hypothetical protein